MLFRSNRVAPAVQVLLVFVWLASVPQAVLGQIPEDYAEGWYFIYWRKDSEDVRRYSGPYPTESRSDFVRGAYINRPYVKAVSSRSYYHPGPPDRIEASDVREVEPTHVKKRRVEVRIAAEGRKRAILPDLRPKVYVRREAGPRRVKVEAALAGVDLERDKAEYPGAFGKVSDTFCSKSTVGFRLSEMPGDLRYFYIPTDAPHSAAMSGLVYLAVQKEWKTEVLYEPVSGANYANAIQLRLRFPTVKREPKGKVEQPKKSATITAYFKNDSVFDKHWTVKDAKTDKVIIDQDFSPGQKVKGTLKASSAGYGEAKYKHSGQSVWTHKSWIEDKETVDMY